MSIKDERERHDKVIQLVRDAVQYDTQLREKYEVGDKFRFVRDRLATLLAHLESHLAVEQVSMKDDTTVEKANDVLVYVYLYNTQGAVLRSWQPLLIPKVFYEYSVNRPIYAEKSSIENILRSKPGSQQHAYLTISVKRENILPITNLQDAQGNALIKVKEGSLHFKNLITFTHNNEDYIVDAQGNFVKGK